MPRTLEQAKQRQTELMLKAQDLNTKTQNGTWNPDTDMPELQSIFNEYEAVGKEIDTFSTRNAMLTKMINGLDEEETPTSVAAAIKTLSRGKRPDEQPRRWTNNYGKVRQFTFSEEERRIYSVIDPSHTKEITKISATPEYLGAFNRYLRKPQLYRDGAGGEAFQRDVQSLLPEKTFNVLRQDNDTRGGMFTLPEYLMDGILKELDNATHCLGLSNQITVESSDTMSIRTRTDKATFVGARSELGNYLKTIEDGLKWGKRSMKTNEFAMVALISEQLLDHATVDVWSMYLDEIRLAGSEWTEQKLLYGTGVGEPYGLFNATNTDGIKTNRDVAVISGDLPDTAPSNWSVQTRFGYQTLLRTWLSLKPGYQNNAVWMFNSNQIMNLCLLTDPMGQYIWKPDTTTGISNTLLGRRVIHNLWAPNVQAAGEYAGILGDFNYLWVLWHRRMRMKTLREILALQGLIVTALDFQFDAMPVMSEAFARIKYAAS